MSDKRLLKGAAGAAAYVKDAYGVEVSSRSIYHLIECGRVQPIRPSGAAEGQAYIRAVDLDRLYSPETFATGAA